MVRAKIIDIWRKSVHDLGGEKGLERGIFAEYSKNLVRFLLTFAETTHPREGTETEDGQCYYRIVPETTHPREGTETTAHEWRYAAAKETTHPREGTETKETQNNKRKI